FHLKQMQASGTLAQHGLKQDDQGNIVADENSPAYQQQQQREETLKAQADYMRAGVAVRKAQAEVDRQKGDPNSPAYKLAYQKLAVEQQGQAAAKERAQAY